MINVKKILLRTLIWLIVSIFIIWIVFPIFWIISISLKQEIEVLAYPPLIFKFSTIQNYIELLVDKAFMKSFLNSAIIGMSTSLLSLMIGLPAAYIMARFNFAGRGNLHNMVIMTRMIPPVVVLIPYFIIFRFLNLYDSHISIILMHILINLSLVIWVSKGFFKDIPSSIEESALIDGATYWGIFIKIIIPIALPLISTLGILTFLFSWNEFVFALSLGSTDAITAPVYISKYMSYEKAHWGRLMASSMIIMLPPIIFVLATQKGLVRGLTFGAVKE